MRVVRQKSKWLTDARSHGANVVAKCYVTSTFNHCERPVQMLGLDQTFCRLSSRAMKQRTYNLLRNSFKSTFVALVHSVGLPDIVLSIFYGSLNVCLCVKLRDTLFCCCCNSSLILRLDHLTKVTVVFSRRKVEGFENARSS